MGLINWLKSVGLSREIKKIQQKTPIEKRVDELLAEELKNMSSTNRTADKLLKVRLMRNETNNTLAKIKDLDDDDEIYDDDDEEGFEEGIKKMLMEKILGGVTKSAPQEAGGSEGNFGVPQEKTQNPLVDAVNELSQAEKDEIKKSLMRR